MKKLTLIILLALFSSTLFATEQPKDYKKVSEKFVEAYNESDYDKIVDMFSLTMMQAVPRNDAHTLFEKFSVEAGKLNSLEFIRMQGGFAIYKGTYEKAVLGVNLALNDRKEISGLYFNEFIEDGTPELVRTKSKMRLPFDGKWFVVWGGDTKEQNYHIENRAQRNAFDFLMKDESGKSFKTDGKTNEDYYCFGKKLFAPCDAEVVMVVKGVKDNAPGVMNPYFPTGNTVILKTENEEYIILAHFKQGSINVKQGDKIKKGFLLGLCGNSGNSSEPHLHFHIQNVEDMNRAAGTKCYFESILVNGEVKNDYSPVQGETVEQK
jgi:murein DD-endopeptidase MepM/ murein hydrolase activator NlpD